METAKAWNLTPSQWDSLDEADKAQMVAYEQTKARMMAYEDQVAEQKRTAEAQTPRRR